MIDLFSKKAKSSSTVHSKWWLGNDWETKYDFGKKGDVESDTVRLHKLSTTKRAISNFVNILCPGKDFKVEFNSRGQSYTDGKTVTIGCDIVEPKDFDINVGLALHEASHLLLTDFGILKNLESRIGSGLMKKALNKINASPQTVRTQIQTLINVIEDRRIDHYVYTTAPGYGEYYLSLYDKYFNNASVEQLLASSEMREETYESYETRIINLHSKSTDLDALVSLRKIAKVIDLDNISRLKSTSDVLEIAKKVYEIIINSVPPLSAQPDDEDGDGQGDGSGDGQGDESESGGGDESESGDGDESESGDGEGTESGSGNSEGNGKMKPSALKRAMNGVNDQRKFVNGDFTPKTITNDDLKKLSEIAEAGIDIKRVGESFESRYGSMGDRKGVDCIIYHKVTDKVIRLSDFPLTYVSINGPRVKCESSVANGKRLGRILGKKLQVRGEQRDTVYSRQEKGKIDKRLISGLGYGQTGVFFSREIDCFKKANLHISVDASGSMMGEKWYNTITNVVSICTAAEMISNIDVQVSFRTTSNSKPCVIMAYDSRVDSITKVYKHFKYYGPDGTTPEGLCFESIMKNFIPVTNDIDSYFLNISDGEPYFNCSSMYYSGQMAAEHTRSQVNKIRKMGINVLSYFVGSNINNVPDEFGVMYGRSASFIDVTNVGQITKTLNGLFLSK